MNNNLWINFGMFWLGYFVCDLANKIHKSHKDRTTKLVEVGSKPIDKNHQRGKGK